MLSVGSLTLFSQWNALLFFFFEGASKACHCLYQFNSDKMNKQLVSICWSVSACLCWFLHFRLVSISFFPFFVVPSTLKRFNNLLMDVLFEDVCNLRHILKALFCPLNHIDIHEVKVIFCIEGCSRKLV